MRRDTEDEDQTPPPHPRPLLARKPLSLPRPRRVRAVVRPHHSQPQGALARSPPGDRRGARPERLQVAPSSSWHASPTLLLLANDRDLGFTTCARPRPHDPHKLTGWLVSRRRRLPLKDVPVAPRCAGRNGVCEGHAVGPADALLITNMIGLDGA